VLKINAFMFDSLSLETLTVMSPEEPATLAIVDTELLPVSLIPLR
jgi:hypothetical protein